MEATGSPLLRLLVVWLGFSHLLCSDAVPSTRTEFLTRGLQVGQLPAASPNMPGTCHLPEQEAAGTEEYVGERKRIAVELNDYPGSGANNRHTPRPQFGRGCIDC